MDELIAPLGEAREGDDGETGIEVRVPYEGRRRVHVRVVGVSMIG